MTFALVSVALALVAPTLRPQRGQVVVLAVFVATLAFLLIGRGSVLLALGLAGGTAAWYARSVLAARAARRRDAALSRYTGAVTADLRAGASLPAALASAAERLPADTPPGLRRALVAAGLVAARGGSISQALDGPGLGELAGLIRVGERHGLPLAHLLEQARARQDARRRHASATAAQLKGPQATAIVLALLPLVGIAMGQAMGASPVRLLTGGGLGGVILVAGTGLGCAGFVWCRIILGRAAA